MIRRLVLAAILGLGLAPTAAADFEQGAAALEIGDYATAYREFRPLAERGHQDAQFALGEMYRNGAGVPQDDAQAFAWFRRAAEGGHTESQTVVGLFHAYGVGTERDAFQAYFWFSLAAIRANPVAETNRDKMARLLSAAERAEADRLVAQRRRQAKALRRDPAPAVAVATPEAGPEAEPEAVEAAPEAPTVAVATPEAETAEAAEARDELAVAPAATPEAEPRPEATEATEARDEPVVTLAALSGAFRVQLGAFKVAEYAPAVWRRLRATQPDLLGSLELRIRRAERGDSVFHLLQVGPLADAKAAKALCAALAARGVDCLVVSP